MRNEIVDRVLHFMRSEDFSDEAFNDLALNIFRYQYSNNKPFQMYCRQKGKTPRMVKSWKDIPAVPINAFKELTLSCEDTEFAEDVFMTSGTTKGVRGKHYHPTLEVYNQSMLKNFKARFMKEHKQIKMGILFPTEKNMPNSSLSHYLALAYKEYGTHDSQYFVDEQGLKVDSLLLALEQAEELGQPIALLGASFSFVHLFDESVSKGEILPPSSWK